jgi:dephospho-CoA kinase
MTKKIGLTGGIGAGKTTVAKVFQYLGVPVFYADEIAKQIIQNNEEVKTKITVLLGNEAYLNNQYNRLFVADKVFKDVSLLQSLNNIVHPKVEEAFQEFINQHQSASYVLKEAAILFETGGDKKLDAVIFVNAPLTIRMNRVVKRDQVASEKVIERMNNQWSDEVKMQKSDYIIDNSGEKLVVPQALSLHHKLINE